VAALARRPFCVGFAAETDNVLEYAAGKRKRKNLDMIAANRVGVADRGFDSDQNTLHVLWEGGEKALPMADKTSIGRDLIALIAERYHAGR
jgi:phosphopantothenoylcysteine decarboxylase/phosphopantothenate--cysteine ligase